MGDILIRGVPDDLVVEIDAKASSAGLSRAEYLRRVLARECTRGHGRTTVADLERFAERCADLADPEVMAKAWS
ncbi:antitoxin [Candidatus Poriferisocius sp.]|uniref:type II toxin-antitoxin system VapB family antitoxin n=1 Tax=Candidatus Poriferisocius sp. TaxID=3101276 RepID=UPI003B023986